ALLTSGSAGLRGASHAQCPGTGAGRASEPTRPRARATGSRVLPHRPTMGERRSSSPAQFRYTVPMPTSPIAITGMGCITPCGNSVAELWRNLIEGRSGIARVTRLDTAGFEVPIAGEVKDFDPTSYGYDG